MVRHPGTNFRSLRQRRRQFNFFLSDSENLMKTEKQVVFTNQKLSTSTQDIVVLERRNSIIVSNLNSGKITEYDVETGSILVILLQGISVLTRMKIGADSLLYVLQWQGNGGVLRYDLEGNLVDTLQIRTYQTV